jgi:hypothetical protein
MHEAHTDERLDMTAQKNVMDTLILAEAKKFMKGEPPDGDPDDEPLTNDAIDVLIRTQAGSKSIDVNDEPPGPMDIWMRDVLKKQRRWSTPLDEEGTSHDN